MARGAEHCRESEESWMRLGRSPRVLAATTTATSLARDTFVRHEALAALGCGCETLRRPDAGCAGAALLVLLVLLWWSLLAARQDLTLASHTTLTD